MNTARAGKVWRTAIVGAWLVMLALLIRYEAFPEYFTHTLPGYQGLLNDDVLLEDNWSRLLYKGRAIGYSHTAVEIDETDPARHYTLANRVYVRLKALGFDQPVFVDTTAFVGITHVLQGFTFQLSSRNYRMTIEGKRRDGEQFAVTMVTGSSSQELEVTIPDDVVIYSPMTEMAMRRLRPGAELSFKTFDPATLNPTRMTIRAVGEEDIVVAGVTNRAMRLATKYQGVTVDSWMAADGTVLRQETPMGWILEASTAEDALATVRHAESADDLVADMAVRVTGRLRAPEQASRLRLRLSGAPLNGDALATDRQRVLEEDADGVVLKVAREGFRPGEAARAGALDPGAREAALASTTFVQSAHPEIVKQAARITEGLVDDRRKALAILDWVHANVRKEMTVSLPSALDVLESMAGDCNEHTYLFTALARAAGVPAKIMVGLAYQKGSFYYHAWPAVFLGEWIEMDPTWGQHAVDATHIRLTEGELEQQVDLVQVVGRLRIEVLAEE